MSLESVSYCCSPPSKSLPKLWPLDWTTQQPPNLPLTSLAFSPFSTSPRDVAFSDRELILWLSCLKLFGVLTPWLWGWISNYSVTHCKGPFMTWLLVSLQPHCFIPALCSAPSLLALLNYIHFPWEGTRSAARPQFSHITPSTWDALSSHLLHVVLDSAPLMAVTMSFFFFTLQALSTVPGIG